MRCCTTCRPSPQSRAPASCIGWTRTPAACSSLPRPWKRRPTSSASCRRARSDASTWRWSTASSAVTTASMRQSAGTRYSVRKWPSFQKVVAASRPSRATESSKPGLIARWLNARWKPVAPTRSVCTWHRSATRCSATRSTARHDPRLPAFHRQALHATRLGLVHPASGLSLQWEVPMPDDLGALVESLRHA